MTVGGRGRVLRKLQGEFVIMISDVNTRQEMRLEKEQLVYMK